MSEQQPREVIPFTPGQSEPARERLDSWKEIAAYLNRGARTVQRWEREEGLPVHRLRHDKLGSVYAYKPELDAWWTSRRAELENEPPAAAPRDTSIAVLPFSDLSREKDQEYFCEGIAEEILSALSRLEGLRVISRSSSFRFRGGDTDVREVGRHLRVRNVLEGSVRKAADRLRIVVQLSDADNGYQLWSETYDRQLRDVFAVQEDIARSVVGALEVTLSPKDQARLGKTPTQDVRAYDLYLRGRKFFYGYGPQDMDFAIQLFTRAVAQDPGFALAYAGLADCWSYIYLYAGRSEAVREQAGWAAARAVELAPDLAQAHASLATTLSLSRQDEASAAEFETAIRLDPKLFEAYYFYARLCFARGQQQKAVQLYEEAMRVRPDDYQSPLLVAQSYDDLGRPGEARACREKGIELAERHLSLNPDDVRAHYMAANGLAALGDNQRARELAGRARALRPEDGMMLYNVGCVYALLGSLEDAIDCLERAADRGLTEKGWYLHDSNLDPLRGHPRFRQLLERLL